jgi:hypothetical protein
MRQIVTVAENHHPRLSAARNLKTAPSATLVILVSPMNGTIWDDAFFASMARHVHASWVHESIRYVRL